MTATEPVAEPAEPTSRPHSATYSPEDNKIRIYPAYRLDKDTYARVRAAGFIWAPKQELFVAPAWTPERENLAEELCGEVGDEDTSLVDRAEQRAERFEDYSEKRERDADLAKAESDRISNGIPLGQPILVGHHSERRARKDAERIRDTMTRAVKMWETSKYWTSRAAGAIRHAKYKELPAVRARRIKKLEAERRGVERHQADAVKYLKLWRAKPITLERAKAIANYDHISGKYPVALFPRLTPEASTYEGEMSLWSALDGILTPEQARLRACKCHVRGMRHRLRWLAHFDNRLAYERAMLAESGGLVADRQEMKPGGQVLRRGTWYVILKVNPQSVTVSGHFATTITFDEIKDYRPPTEETSAAVSKAMKLPPLCNYPGEGFKHMTRAELDAEKCRQWSDFGKIKRIGETSLYGAHRVNQTRGPGAWDRVSVYVTDEKVKYPPAPAAIPKEIFAKTTEIRTPRPPAEPDPKDAAFQALAATAKAEPVVVSSPDLFPTPKHLAAWLVRLAELEPGMTVLEPSAGTGRILDELPAELGKVRAVERSYTLANRLTATYPAVQVFAADFLEWNECGEHGHTDRIIMNPPFSGGQDIKHVLRAVEQLNPGGRVVSLVANGPRQQEKLKPLASEWIDVEGEPFAEAGTKVRVAIVVIDKPAEERAPDSLFSN